MTLGLVLVVVGAILAVGGWRELGWRRSPLVQANLALAESYHRRRRARQRWHGLEWLIIACAGLSLLGWLASVAGAVR